MKAEAARWTASQRDEAQGSDDERLYAAHAAADLLGIHRSTLYLAVRHGKLTPDAYTPGGHARFSMATLRRFSERLAYGSATGGESNATRALARAVASLSRFAALKPACEVIVDAVLEACPFLDCSMVITLSHDNPRKAPTMVAGKGVTHQLQSEYRWLRRRPGLSFITSLRAQQSQRVIIDDGWAEHTDVPEGSLQALRASGFRSCVMFPCDHDGVTLGYLIGMGRNPSPCTEHELAALGALADVATHALRRSWRENAIQAQIKATEEMMRSAAIAPDGSTTAQHLATVRSVFQQATRARLVYEWELSEKPAADTPPRLIEAMRLAASENSPQRVCWLTDGGPVVAIATPTHSTHPQAAVGAYWRRTDLRSGMELAFLQVYAQAYEIVTRSHGS